MLSAATILYESQEMLVTVCMEDSDGPVTGASLHLAASDGYFGSCQTGDPEALQMTLRSDERGCADVIYCAPERPGLAALEASAAAAEPATAEVMVLGWPSRINFAPSNPHVGPDGDTLQVLVEVTNDAGYPVSGATVVLDHVGGELLGRASGRTDNDGALRTSLRVGRDATLCASAYPRRAADVAPVCPSPEELQKGSDGATAREDEGFGAILITTERPAVSWILPREGCHDSENAIKFVVAGSGFGADPIVFVGDQQGVVTASGEHFIEFDLPAPDKLPFGYQTFTMANLNGYAGYWGTEGGPGFEYTSAAPCQ